MYTMHILTIKLNCCRPHLHLYDLHMPHS